MSGVVRSSQSSFYGKEIGNRLFVSKDVDTQRRSRATITSLVLILGFLLLPVQLDVVSFVNFVVLLVFSSFFSYLICAV